MYYHNSEACQLLLLLQLMTYELLSNQDWIVKGYVFIKAFEKDAIVNPQVE